MMDDAIVDLQMKLSFQDGLLEELNTVIISQQQQIDHLQLAIETLKVQIGSLQSALPSSSEADEIPPHY